jgi:hypothetical protein
MFIRTDRLFLRPLWSEDLTQALALGGADSLGPLADRRLPALAVIMPSGNQLIGLAAWVQRAGACEAVVALLRDVQGAGFETEVRRALAELAMAIGVAEPTKPAPVDAGWPGRGYSAGILAAA